MSRLRAAAISLGGRRHSTFLVAIVAAIAVRPVIGNVRVGPLGWPDPVALLLVALSTIEVDELLGDRLVLLARRQSPPDRGLDLGRTGHRRSVPYWCPNLGLGVAGTVSWFLFFAFATTLK